MSETDLEKFLLKINQPQNFGPGYWRLIHVIALDANTYMKKMQFIQLIQTIFNSIPCLDPCRHDALDYLNKHPLTEYWNIVVNGEDIGMFYWSVDCHNWVNRKLGKPYVPREVAYRFYKHPDDFVCQEDCHDNFSSRVTSPLTTDAIKKDPNTKKKTPKAFGVM